jgi:hypothetical protein
VCIAVAIGTIAGYGLVFLIKGIIMNLPGYTLAELVRDRAKFQGTLISAFALGLFVSLFFLLKFRETPPRRRCTAPKPSGTSFRSSRWNPN